MAREDSSPAPQASRKVDKGSHLEVFLDPCLAPQASKKGRWAPERRKAPGAGVEDFVLWIAPISSLPPASKEEEEEDEMADLVHNFGAWKRK